MNRFRWRLRPLLFAGAVVLVATVLVLAERTAEFVVRQVAAGGTAPGEALGDLRAVFLLIALVGLALALALTALAGGHIIGHLAQLRAYAAARARGDSATVPRSDIAEVQTAVTAVDLLASELERQRTDVALERDELGRLLGSVSEGILQVDTEARLVHANPAARSILGLRAPPRGQPVGAFIRNAELRDLIGRAAAGTDVSPREISLDERRMLVNARPVRRSGGADGHDGAVVSFTDLTELRRLEGVRRDFVANVSHELKTPLTSIRGYVETLLDEDLPPDMQRQFLEVIRKNAGRLHGIIDDLLDLSRLESGGWRPELREVDAMELLLDAWNALRERTGGRRIEFIPVGGHATVRADPAALHQVLVNLFDNAIRHTPDGGRITARVERTARRPGHNVPAADSVIIEILDTGSGIPREALPRIFERFYRVDPARSRADGGTGLGLSIVRHLVESMGGEVTADSELGKGTRLRVRLPAA